MRNKRREAVLAKILFSIGVVLLIGFFLGLVYLRKDYYTNAIHSYASTPLYVYNIIHGVVFLVPSAICVIIALLFYRKSTK